MLDEQRPKMTFYIIVLGRTIVVGENKKNRVSVSRKQQEEEETKACVSEVGVRLVTVVSTGSRAFKGCLRPKGLLLLVLGRDGVGGVVGGSQRRRLCNDTPSSTSLLWWPFLAWPSSGSTPKKKSCIHY